MLWFCEILHSSCLASLTYVNISFGPLHNKYPKKLQWWLWCLEFRSIFIRNFVHYHFKLNHIKRPPYFTLFWEKWENKFGNMQGIINCYNIYTKFPKKLFSIFFYSGLSIFNHTTCQGPSVSFFLQQMSKCLRVTKVASGTAGVSWNHSTAYLSVFDLFLT